MKEEHAGERAVNASPTKTFFLEIITKDITIEDCILDLVDNSLDGHVAQTGLDVSQYLLEGAAPPKQHGVEISIEVSPTRLTLTDNTGGIPIKKAMEEVFRFGFSEGPGESPGLGVYGIGMKRAFFKLGRTIDVVSRTTREGFSVHIDTGKWLHKFLPDGKDDWTFDLEPGYGPAMKAKPGDAGTTIEITDLNEGIGKLLGLTTTQVELKRRLETTYSLFLQAGINLRLNQEQLTPKLPRIVTKEIPPSRVQFREGNVDILVTAGLLSPKSDTSQAGWHVFCNGRQVLEADRTARTGWVGTQYHSKFNRFVGYVNFRCDDPRELPWGTTKTNIVYESPVYQAAYAKIIAQTPPVLAYLSGLYKSGTDDLEEARRARDATTDAPLTEAPKEDSTFSPPRTVRESPYTSLNFEVLKSDVERVRARIGKPTMSARRIGIFTFKYYLKKECD